VRGLIGNEHCPDWIHCLSILPAGLPWREPAVMSTNDPKRTLLSQRATFTVIGKIESA